MKNIYGILSTSPNRAHKIKRQLDLPQPIILINDSAPYKAYGLNGSLIIFTDLEPDELHSRWKDECSLRNWTIVFSQQNLKSLSSY